jgi:GNAT superfamily N-acetyltransferase
MRQPCRGFGTGGGAYRPDTITAVLRQAQREDIPAMHRVRLAVRENRLTSDAVTEASYLPALEQTGRGWVVESAGTIVAFAVGNARTGNIWALFVDPAHERRGYGRQLHDAMVEWLWSQGLPRLWLTTEPGTRAQRFYEAAGWRYTGVADPGDAGYELLKPGAGQTPRNPGSLLSISYLADLPGAADALIPGLLEQWRHIAPELTAESRAASFAAHRNRKTLPIAWVAHSAEELMGTAALRAHDLEGRDDLTPWLGGVYVRPEFRHRGIASALCRTVEEKARLLGYRQLFLFTLDQQALYSRLGWQHQERVLWRGWESDIMSKDLELAR